MDEYNIEQLLKKINVLETELKASKKYGLVWDKENTKEDVVIKCEKNIPILEQDKSKKIICGEDNNILIEGDNYHALTSLNFIVKESIDVIYIDPPYNTGHQDFEYNDKFVNEDDGYKHSKWLSFMSKRLKLAKDLLNQNGCIFISIDDREQANLKILCDSIFGTGNFICNMIWTNNEGGGGSDSKYFKTKHEYILCYAKNSSNFKTKNVPIEDQDRYKLSDEYEKIRGKYQLVKLSSASIQYSQSLDYPIQMPDGSFITPVENSDKDRSCWRWSKQKLQWGLDNDFIVYKKDKKGVWQIYTKQYVNCDIDGNIVPRTKVPPALINKFSSTQASNALIDLLKSKKFSYPKPVDLIKWLIDRCVNERGIVLDFFAGSGTTGQAVLELNKEDGGHRRFILCTNNENNICTDVTYPRLKTVITGIRPDGTKYSDGLPANLYYFKTDFIEDQANTEQARYNLVEKVDSLLCIAEDVMEEVERNDYSSHFINGDKHLFIYNDYYNETKFDEFKQRVLSATGQKIVYVYASDNNIDETLIEGNDIELKPIPSKIYEIYKEIVEDIKRGE